MLGGWCSAGKSSSCYVQGLRSTFSTTVNQPHSQAGRTYTEFWNPQAKAKWALSVEGAGKGSAYIYRTLTTKKCSSCFVDIDDQPQKWALSPTVLPRAELRPCNQSLYLNHFLTYTLCHTPGFWCKWYFYKKAIILISGICYKSQREKASLYSDKDHFYTVLYYHKDSINAILNKLFSEYLLQSVLTL